MSEWRNGPEVRTQNLRVLELLVNRYPNIRVGQLVADAVAGKDLTTLDDADLGYCLNHLLVIYTQLEAAGLVRRTTKARSTLPEWE